MQLHEHEISIAWRTLAGLFNFGLDVGRPTLIVSLVVI